MKNNRLILTIIFMAVTFCFFMPTDVKANYTAVSDACLDKNECMLVCNYNNTYKGNNNATRQRNISIYYVYKNKQWKVKWEATNEDRFIHSKGPVSFSNVFSNSGENVYSEKDLNSDSFVCPKYGYLDMSELNPNNELCFDNNGKYCEAKSNLGTAFGKKAKKFIGKKKDYDVLDQVSAYSDKWIIGDMPCSEFGEINKDNVGTIIREKMEKDFQTNFMKGKSIPKFILNSNEYRSNIEKSVEKKIKTCSAEIDEMQKKGEIDDGTAEKWKNNIQNLDPKDVQDAVDDARDKMGDDSNFDLSDYNQPQDCKGIFGDPTEDEESLAYLIQTILNYIKVIGPILVVLLSSFDFVKVIWTSDDENMKKAQQKLAKRLVAAVLLFLLPLLIEIMFNLINDSIVDPTCGIK